MLGQNDRKMKGQENKTNENHSGCELSFDGPSVDYFLLPFSCPFIFLSSTAVYG